jgi:hypothetical protein
MRDSNIYSHHEEPCNKKKTLEEGNQGGKAYKFQAQEAGVWTVA